MSLTEAFVEVMRRDADPAKRTPECARARDASDTYACKHMEQTEVADNLRRVECAQCGWMFHYELPSLGVA